MITLISFANYLSILPLVFAIFISIYYIGSLVFSKIPYIFSEKYILGYFSSIFIAQLIKYILFPFFEFAKRPEGACGCDYISQKGDVSGRPGCPSGHMSTTAYFVVYNLMILINGDFIKKNINKNFFIVANIVLLLLMAWARYYKKCHSFIQILLGIILGSILAYFFYSN
jgi:membrane-associated phospholipid phosphatase